jgi:hypothetical protein
MGRPLSSVNADFSFCWSTSSETSFHTAEGIMALVDPALRALYDLKVSGKHFKLLLRIIAELMMLFQDFRPM